MKTHKDHIQHNIDLLQLSPADQVNTALMYTLRNQFQCVDFMKGYETELLAKMLANYQQHAIDYHPSDYLFELDCYQPDEIDEKRFKQMICESTVFPFVIRGFAKATNAVKKWTIDYLAKHYADAQVAYLVEYADGRFADALFGRLEDVAASMKPGNPDKVYVHNTSQIFKDYGQLLEDLQYDRLCEYYKPIAVNAIVQLFMGGSKTGVRMHCANEFNSFLMIYGEKHWTFIPPDFTYALKPTLSSNGLNALCSIIDHHQSFEAFEKSNPLYNRLPKYTVTLQPGDMLVFSPWWWHAVSNTSPTSIAIASRWTTIKPDTFPRGNITLSNIQKSNPFFKQYSKTYIASVLKDELIGDKALLRDTFGRYHGSLYDEGDE